MLTPSLSNQSNGFQRVGYATTRSGTPRGDTGSDGVGGCGRPPPRRRDPKSGPSGRPSTPRTTDRPTTGSRSASGTVDTSARSTPTTTSAVCGGGAPTHTTRRPARSPTAPDGPAAPPSRARRRRVVVSVPYSCETFPLFGSDDGRWGRGVSRVSGPGPVDVTGADRRDGDRGRRDFGKLGSLGYMTLPR